MATLIDIVVFKFREIWPMRNRRNRVLLTWPKNTKFWLPLKLSLLCRSRPKSAWTSPQQHAHSTPDFIQIGSVSVEL